MNKKVKDNPAAKRYEMEVDGQTVFADYRLNGQSVEILHVETPIALRGKGAAGELMQGIMQIANEQGLKIIPICPYAITWINRHKK